MSNLNDEIIGAAIEGFEAQKQRLDSRIAELRQMLSGAPAETVPAAVTPGGQGRKVSAAGRARMAEAQRRRWAAKNGSAAPAKVAASAKPKRKMSAAGRKAIADAVKRRWAALKAGK